nr:MAG TPA: protein kinase [Microviridae sp.]
MNQYSYYVKLCIQYITSVSEHDPNGHHAYNHYKAVCSPFRAN